MQRKYDEKKVITLQKYVRGFLARKQFGVKQLPKSQQENYEAFAVGNDPIISGLSTYQVKSGKTALIATSGLRAVELACELGNEKDTPKIIIVDNSKEVCEFWRRVRTLAKEVGKKSDKKTFLSELALLLEKLGNTSNSLHPIYRDLSDSNCFPSDTYPDQNILRYVDGLINKFGYKYIVNVICQTTIIAQSWLNTEALIKIKNILTYQQISNVFMYPSNIPHCIANEENEEKANEVLENIEKIHPTLSIYTDCCPMHHIPENVFLTTDCNADKTRQMLFGSSMSCQTSSGNTRTLRINLDDLSSSDLFMLLMMMSSNRSNRSNRNNNNDYGFNPFEQ